MRRRGCFAGAVRKERRVRVSSSFGAVLGGGDGVSGEASGEGVCIRGGCVSHELRHAVC